jgi:hypothetical protein
MNVPGAMPPDSQLVLAAARRGTAAPVKNFNGKA